VLLQLGGKPPYFFGCKNKLFFEDLPPDFGRFWSILENFCRFEPIWAPSAGGRAVQIVRINKLKSIEEALH
jgi:hypothetical protein